jgi:hypothetical protein
MEPRTEIDVGRDDLLLLNPPIIPQL